MVSLALDRAVSVPGRKEREKNEDSDIDDTCEASFAVLQRVLRRAEAPSMCRLQGSAVLYVIPNMS